MFIPVLNCCADEDSSRSFLVDFEQKSIDVLTEKKKAEKAKADAEEDKKRREDEEEQRLLSEKIEESGDPDDQWYYIYSFIHSLILLLLSLFIICLKLSCISCEMNIDVHWTLLDSEDYNTSCHVCNALIIKIINKLGL